MAENTTQAPARRRLELTGFEKFWYYFVNIISFASLYFVKIAAKKALIEASQKR